MTKFEEAVIGAGPAGLAAALALAHSGVETALVGPPFAPSKAEADRRTAALIGTRVRLRQGLGGRAESRQSAVGRRQSDSVEDAPADTRLPTALGSDPPGPTPIAALRIADDRGTLIRAPEMLFRAAEIGLESFGVNVPNPAL